MFKFTAKLKGLEKGQKMTEDKARRILLKCMLKMQELAINYAPVDQGEIRQNIDLFPQILANDYRLISKSKHSEPMEYGTKPFWAPIDPLKAWAARKTGDESLGYAVQKKIAAVGIKAHPFMRPAFRQVIDYWYDYYVKQEFSE